MTHPNPKDPQAELKRLITGSEFQDYLYSQPEECVDAILALFQAHQQQLLTELLGELPERQPMQPTPNPEIVDTEIPTDPRFGGGKAFRRTTKNIPPEVSLAKQEGFNKAIDEVASILERKIGELNG